MKQIQFLIMILLFGFYDANATHELHCKSLSGVDLKNPNLSMISLQDQFYNMDYKTNPGTPSYTISGIKNSVKLRFDNTSKKYWSTGWKFKVSFKVNGYNPLESVIGNGQTYELNIEYDPLLPYQDRDMVILDLSNEESPLDWYNKIELVFKSVEFTDPQGYPMLNSSGNAADYPIDIYLDLQMDVDRQYTFDSEQSTSHIKSGTITNHELPVFWNYQYGATSYDLEWLFVESKYYGEQEESSNILELIPFDMKNACRINTSFNSFNIPCVYPTGYIIYRVRGIGMGEDLTLIPGQWDFMEGSCDKLGCVPSRNIYEYSGLDEDLNWQYNAVYAEDGKKKEVMQYYDGMLRSRQEMTYTNTNRNTIISETIYDFQGRAALQTLASPVQTDYGIKFYQGFNGNYNPSNFDVDALYNNPQPMDSVGPGAEHYYSRENTDKDGSNAYVPLAKGYPFSLKKFLPDGTDRVVFESSPGFYVRQGTGHESYYYYGTPTGSEELDRLFGNNSGNVVHYSKNLTRDQNGQYSVSYLNQEGKVIATALAGSAPLSMTDIDNKPAKETVTCNLLRCNAITDNELISQFGLIVPTTGSYAFNYSLTPAELTSTCLTNYIDCYYDLNIKITDQDGELIKEEHKDSITLYGSLPPTFNVQLTAGGYNVVKSLKLHHRGIRQEVNNLFKSSCITGYKIRSTAPCKCKDLCLLSYCIPRIGEDTLFVNGDITGLSWGDVKPLVEACQKQCDTIIYPNKCDKAKSVLVFDMSPGGQYFDNLPSAENSLNNSNINGWLITHLQTYSTNIFNYINATFFNQQTVVTNWDDLRLHWKDEIAEEYLWTYHPEHAIWQFNCDHNCEGDGNNISVINEYETRMLASTNMKYAEPNRLLNPTGLPKVTTHNGPYSNNGYSDYVSFDSPETANLDPIRYYFCHSAYSNNNSICPVAIWQLNYHLQHMIPYEADNNSIQYYSIWYLLDDPDNIHGTYPANKPTDELFINLHGHATNPSIPALLGDGPNQISKYQFFRNIYLFWRDYYIYKTAKIAIGSSYLADANNDGLTSDGFAIRYRVNPIFENIEIDPLTCLPNLSTAILNQQLANIQTQIEDSCKSICEESADRWISEIMPCFGNDTYLINHVRELFIDICQNNCGTYHPLGSVGCTLHNQNAHPASCIRVTCSHNVGEMFNFQDVLNAHGITGCVAPLQPDTVTDHILARCGCNRFKTFSVEYDNDGDMSSALQMLTGITFTSAQFANWRNTCQSAAVSSADLESIAFPEIFACDQYSNPEPASTASVLAECEQSNLAIAQYYNKLEEQRLRDSIVNRLDQQYCAECMEKAAENETFTVTYSREEYCYTLYYYDQAGNLVKTVPPSGVRVLSDPQDLANVVTCRANAQCTTKVMPAHILNTTYTYNSLNNIKTKSTPDDGISEYWYDAGGRLVFSKSASQSANQFSYTKYDNVGRIVENGEMTNSSVLIDDDYTENTALSQLESLIDNANKTMVIQTYYDKQPNDESSFYNTHSEFKENLRSRVAMTRTSNSGGVPNNIIWDIKTYYCYDPQGNVRSIVQRFPALPEIAQDFRIDYQYDLISGKVNAVNYQDGLPDAFYHRYEYDADNRITNVYTSRDKYHWDQDAEYSYYRHGPLARTELGNQKVQGLDYAYTLQGWIKGVNSETLYTNRDMGKDGVAASSSQDNTYLDAYKGIHSNVAQDAIGYTLNYFAGDYTGMKAFQNTNNFLTCNFQYQNQLYNGNISSMVTAIDGHSLPSTPDYDFRPMLSEFKYDQLNRIKEMKSLIHQDAISNSWFGLTTTNQYKSLYTYDYNGNITSLARSDKAGIWIDDLSYKYQYTLTNPPNSSNLVSNRLYHINDNIINSAPATDLEDQPGYNEFDITACNYGYDASGNLVKDNSENISNIVWNCMGKMRKIVRGATPIHNFDIEYLYDAMGNRIEKIVKGKINGVQDNESTWEYYYYLRDAQGNLMALYKRNYSLSQEEAPTPCRLENFKLEEYNIYGSSRIGIIKPQCLNLWNKVFTASIVNGLFTNVVVSNTIYPDVPTHYPHRIGDREYELTNHLGNVLAVISDMKISMPSTIPYPPTIDHYRTDIVSRQDYYPGGMLMPGRSYSSTSYRFGFNGKENDNEVKGTGNSQDYGNRIYDTRAVRFLSVDPIAGKYPMLTPYQFASNSPIMGKDLDGLELIVTNKTDNSMTIIGNVYYVSEGQYAVSKPLLQKATEDNIVSAVNNNPEYQGAMKVELKLNYIAAGTYENATKLAQNSTVNYTDSKGVEQTVSDYRTGVVVANPPENSKLYKSYFERNADRKGCYDPKASDGDKPFKLILFRNARESDVNNTPYNAEQWESNDYRHEMGHFLFTPNEANGNPGATSSDPKLIQVTPGDIQSASNPNVKRDAVRKDATK